jgi:putative oxidoreductase
MITGYRRVTEKFDRIPDLALTLARVVLGLLFIDHGLQKYHAKGGVASFEYFLRSLKNIPAPGLTSHVVPAFEVVGGVVLIVGVLSRVVALLFAAEMVVTGFVVKAHDLHAGLVSAQTAGVELDLVYLVLLLSVLVLGPGRLSLDAAVGLERRNSTTSALAVKPEGRSLVGG